MNILTTKDLLTLTIFRCRLCNRRLRYPIMEVGDLGNVCGNCFDRKLHTDAVQNDELCLLMEKLHFSCYYDEDGCTFNGSFQETFEHERRCLFRRGYCPFVYQKKCDKELQMIEIVEHIKKNHSDNIIDVEDGYIMVKNPSDSNPQCLYMFKIGENYFLIRCLLNKGEQRILYTFDRLTNDHSADTVKFHSVPFSSIEKKYRVMHELKLTDDFDFENAFSANLRVLKNLKSVEKLKISFSCSDINVQKVLTTKVLWQCPKCFQMTDASCFCSFCRKFTPSCSSCIVYCCNNNKYSWNLSQHKQLSSTFVCNSIGCNQLIRCDKYLTHQTYLCRFITHQCPFCKDNYSVKEVMSHMLTTHKNIVNPRASVIPLDKPTRHVFINYVDVFITDCNLDSKTNKLSITVLKLIEPNWTDNYIWKIHLRKTGSKSESVTFTSDCTMDGSVKEMDVSDFIYKNSLTFTFFVALI